MSMRNLSIAGAVVAAFCGGSAFAAVPYGPFNTSLTIAGSSAFRDSATNLVKTRICGGAANTYEFRATGTPTPDLRAFSCHTPATNTPLPNQDVVVYYRSELGSVVGVAPIQNNKNIKRLAVAAASCGATPTIGAVTNCTVTNWDTNTDGPTATGVESAPVELGVSDLEPGIFTGSGSNGNYPSNAQQVAFLGADPKGSTTNFASINPLAYQTFTFLVNSGLGANATNLSKQSLTSIFNGIYGNWNQVPKADGSGFVSASSVPIRICERDQGSGTRAAHGIFLGFSKVCGSASYALGPTFHATQCNATTGECSSTGQEVACVAGNAGAIGYAVNQGFTAPASTSYVAIDGKLPGTSAAAPNDIAAVGGYPFYYAANFNYSIALNGNAAKKSIADTILTDLQDAAQLPVSSASLMALPDFNAAVVPVSGTQPVALGSKANSCFEAQNFN